MHRGFFFRESAPHPQIHSERREKLRGDAGHRLALRRARLTHNCRVVAIERDSVERGDPASAFVIVGDRGTVALDSRLRVRVEHRDQATGIRKWQRAQEDGVDYREDGEIGAQANGQSQKRGDREAGRLSQQAGRVTALPDKFVEEAQPARLAAFFLDRVQAAELDSSPPRRLLRRDARPDQVVGKLLDVRPQFLAHPLFEIVSCRKRAE